MEQLSIFWHRRDLRIDDNAGLYQALKNNQNVLPLFIFDTTILERLEDKKDLRVNFIYQQIKALKELYQKQDSDLLVLHGQPLEIFKGLCAKYKIKNIYANHDYEPKAIKRDQSVLDYLKTQNVSFSSFKDQVIFEYSEVTKDDGKPYTVFTPYSKKWKAKLAPFYYKSYPSTSYLEHLKQIQTSQKLMSLDEMGFEEVKHTFPKEHFDKSVIKTYHLTRDIPSNEAGTTRLSVHLRFGTISIRRAVRFALKGNQTWLSELIWRDFYMGNILANFPKVDGHAFKPAYERVEWINNPEHFNAWTQGKTGYPIVDAGMRELNQTGFMHNRVRMITASFLTKHLLIDWRWGEAYFAKKLLDFDLSANNGGWQWAASCGCDAAPYFRVFNPTLQQQKFDKSLAYIKKWVPEFEDAFSYPKPIVEHKFARQRAIDVYKKALSQS